MRTRQDAGTPSRVRLALRILLCLGLVLGQWALLVHASQHELQPRSSHACPICALADLPAAPPCVSPIPLARHGAFEVPHRRLPTLLLRRVIARPFATGPPGSVLT